MDKNLSGAEVIEYMRNSWELVNRGSGWWLQKYRVKSISVSDEVVEELERQGSITTAVPYCSIVASLAV